MARRPSAFRQRDVTRALRAATAAGIGVVRVEIDASGKIVLVTSEPPIQTVEQKPVANEWDKVK